MEDKTKWYDDLCLLYRKTGVVELRNVLWNQVEKLIYDRIHQFIRNRKNNVIMRDRELVDKLFQQAFFIFEKAVEKWDGSSSKFLTFLGNIIDQELKNVISMDLYYKARDKKLIEKLVDRLILDEEKNTFDEVNEEFKQACEEVSYILEDFKFDSEEERIMARWLLYNCNEDFSELKKKKIEFAELENRIKAKILNFVRAKCSDKTVKILEETFGEKIGDKSEKS